MSASGVGAGVGVGEGVGEGVGVGTGEGVGIGTTTPQPIAASSSLPMVNAVVVFLIPAFAPPPVMASVRVIAVAPVATHLTVTSRTLPGPVSSVPPRSEESTRKLPSWSGSMSLPPITLGMPLLEKRRSVRRLTAVTS